MCGTRGIPACYGGFETFAEELGARLAQRGYKVVVYGRKHVITTREPSYKGVELRLLWAPQHKYLETPVHTLFSLLHLLRYPVDVILVCNAANSPFIWIPRLFRRIPVAINVDGIERKRAKWNAVGRLWYRLGEFCSVLFASEMISDADVIREYYLSSYRRDSRVIRYGCHRLPEDLALLKISGADVIAQGAQNPIIQGKTDIFTKVGVKPGDYILYVSRLEPENNAHVLIAAYNALPESYKTKPLLIVGDAPYATEYIAGLKRSAGANVLFAGYRFGDDYKMLQLAAYVYVQATEVGGTHPALVEAMGYANCIIANETPENVEVLSEAGLFYAKNSIDKLTQRLQEVLSSKELVLTHRKRAYQLAQERYDWEKITNSYEGLFKELVA